MSTPDTHNDTLAIRSTALLQALERQRNDALNRQAEQAAIIAVLQQQLQAVSGERDALKAEVEKLKQVEAVA